MVRGNGQVRVRVGSVYGFRKMVRDRVRQWVRV